MPSYSTHCRHCGIKTEKEHNYCHQCGHVLKCPKCSGECDSGFNFCPHCGQLLRSERSVKDHLDGSIKQLQISSNQSQASQIQSASRFANNHQPGVDGAGDRSPTRHYESEVTPRGRNGPLSPISQLLHGKAKVTCAVGAYSRQQQQQSELDMNKNGTPVKNGKQRYTGIMKTYSIIVGKLRGEEDFQQPVKSRMQVVVTHVENNGFFFWGQVLADKLKGNRTNIETLERIGRELQLEESRLGPMKHLGRCAAMEDGVWYRAWNMATTSGEKHDVLYIDFGNTAFVSDSEFCMAAMHIWAIPPMAKPFRLLDAGRNTKMKEHLNKKVTLEIVAPGTQESNYVASVYLVPEDAL